MLMQPCIDDAERERGAGRFPAEIAAIEDDDPVRAADRLIEGASATSVVFSCSHGEGAPRDGWGSPERRRALQGAPSLGRGHRLEAEAVASAPFAPGGVWLMFACFGAGTPARSAYHHWLAGLAAAGEHDADLAQVMSSLPGDGESPFIAALPQAALANPRGPLAVIGHLDLAWSYGFCDVDKLSRGERHRRFHQLVVELVKGTRLGPAIDTSLMRRRNQLQHEIVVAADAAAADPAARAEDPRHPLGHRWMIRQDLMGYIALGDPAVRVGVPARSRRRASEPAPAEVRTEVAARAPAPGAAPASDLPAEAIQAAVHDLLAGRATLDDLAARHGVAPAVVTEWRRVYTDAGLRALASLVASSATR
jgi:hypothetical protein